MKKSILFLLTLISLPTISAEMKKPQLHKKGNDITKQIKDSFSYIQKNVTQAAQKKPILTTINLINIALGVGCICSKAKLPGLWLLGGGIYGIYETNSEDIKDKKITHTSEQK